MDLVTKGDSVFILLKVYSLLIVNLVVKEISKILVQVKNCTTEREVMLRLFLFR